MRRIAHLKREGIGIDAVGALLGVAHNLYGNAFVNQELLRPGDKGIACALGQWPFGEFKVFGPFGKAVVKNAHKIVVTFVPVNRHQVRVTVKFFQQLFSFRKYFVVHKHIGTALAAVKLATAIHNVPVIAQFCQINHIDTAKVKHEQPNVPVMVDALVGVVAVKLVSEGEGIGQFFNVINRQCLIGRLHLFGPYPLKRICTGRYLVKNGMERAHVGMHTVGAVHL